MFQTNGNLQFPQPHMTNDVAMPLISTPPSEESRPVSKQPSWLRFLRWVGEGIRRKPHRFTFFLYVLFFIIIGPILWGAYQMDEDPSYSQFQYYDGDGVGFASVSQTRTNTCHYADRTHRISSAGRSEPPISVNRMASVGMWEIQ